MHLAGLVYLGTINGGACGRTSGRASNGTHQVLKRFAKCVDTVHGRTVCVTPRNPIVPTGVLNRYTEVLRKLVVHAVQLTPERRCGMWHGPFARIPAERRQGWLSRAVRSHDGQRVFTDLICTNPVKGVSARRWSRRAVLTILVLLSTRLSGNVDRIGDGNNQVVRVREWKTILGAPRYNQ